MHQAPGLLAMESPVPASLPAAALPLRTRFSGTNPALIRIRMGLIAVSIRHVARPIKFLPWAGCVALHVTAACKPRAKTLQGDGDGPPREVFSVATSGAGT